MKKIILLILTISSIISSAQNIEITPMAGYSFIGNMNFYQGKIHMDDNFAYGLKIGFSPLENSVLEFSYQGTNTNAQWQPYYNWSADYPSRDLPLSINYFTLALQQERMLANDKTYGFGGIGIGMAYINPNDTSVDDLYSFAISIELGIKILVTDRVGIRMQGSLQMPVYFDGLGFYAGIGSGGSSGGLSLNTGTYFVQGGFSGGLFYKISK